MISHKYKCIFIHIPRTAGTSIEKAISGNNWWNIDQKTKHLLASQAKIHYSPYWDKYFKFSFVRNPWDRHISMKMFSMYFYGSEEHPNSITISQLDWYKKRFGFPLVIENDYRFSDRLTLTRSVHQEQQVYGNILDEKLDFIGRFESLNDDFLEIVKILGLEVSVLPHLHSYERAISSYQNYYSEETKEIVGDIYQNDIKLFNYEF